MSNTEPRPNVLLICVDHLSGLMTRPGGSRQVMTPTLSQLAQAGVYYRNAYTTAPTCIPARRSLMTGQHPSSHGDRVFNATLPMPDAPTLAQCFRDAGYQAFGVGKLHVYPQRDRIGFDDVTLNEEGRHQFGAGSDDWEQHLAERGFAGQAYAGGLCNNDYLTRPWHLPEDCHPTNWAAREMCRTIRRRDPSRPGFWYLSFVGPHPPLWPLQSYMDQYLPMTIDEPLVGDWARDAAQLPDMLRRRKGYSIEDGTPQEVALAHKAFFAAVTHIDHQIRVVVGMLREQGLLDNTIIALTSDHGDMLGDHGQWAKGLMYEMSAKVPLIVVPPANDTRMARGTTDSRLACLEDIMPTLLDLAGSNVPNTVDGMSLVSDPPREHLYGEHYEAAAATRMVRDERYKLIYYPAGNHVQLFDLHEDPREMHNLVNQAGVGNVQRKLTALLIEHLYGGDEAWARNGELVGLPEPAPKYKDTRHLHGQRGLRMY